jgi:hypothetical protein
MSRRIVVGFGVLGLMAASVWLGTALGEGRNQITQHKDIIVRLDRFSGAMETFTVSRSGAMAHLDEIRENRAAAETVMDQFLARREREIQACAKAGRYIGECYRQWHAHATNEAAWQAAWATYRASE